MSQSKKNVNGVIIITVQVRGRVILLFYRTENLDKDKMVNLVLDKDKLYYKKLKIKENNKKKK